MKKSERPPLRSGHLQRKYYFRFCKSGRAAAPPDLLFHGWGVTGSCFSPEPAPLRGAVAQRLRDLSNRWKPKIRCNDLHAERRESSVFSVGAYPLWGLKGASSPFLVAGRGESRGREGGVETPLSPSGPAERPRRRCTLQKPCNLPHAATLCAGISIPRQLPHQKAFFSALKNKASCGFFLLFFVL